MGVGGEAHLLSCMNLRPSAAPIRMPTSTIPGGMKVPCARNDAFRPCVGGGLASTRLARPYLRLIVIVLYLLPHALRRVVVHAIEILYNAWYLKPLEQIGDIW